MSVLPLKADIHQRGLHVRLVPEGDILGLRRTKMLYLITKAIDLWRNHHGSVRSGEAQPNLRSASCFSTPDFDFSHDLAMARHRRQ